METETQRQPKKGGTHVGVFNRTVRSPIVVEWICDNHHRIKTRLEGDSICVPKCMKCNTADGRHFHMGRIINEDAPDALTYFTEKGSADVRTSIIYGIMLALLDLLAAKDGVGEKSKRWCVACEKKDHSRPCECACHRARQYQAAAENPGLQNRVV